MIVKNYTAQTDVIHIINKKNRFSFPVVLRDHDQDLIHPGYPMKPNFYLITDLTEEDTELLVENFLNDSSFNPTAKFLFASRNFATRTLKLLGSRFIANVVFVDLNTGIISSYFPYKMENITEIDDGLVEFGSCLENGTVSVERDLYPQKLKQSWKNSTINIMYSPIEVNCIHNRCKNTVLQKEIIDVIAEYNGFLVTYNKMPDFLNDRGLLSNDNFNGIYLGIQMNQEYLQSTSYFIADRFAWFVPSPRPLPRWSYVIKIFSLRVWIAWMLTTVAVSATWILKEYLLFRKPSIHSILVIPSTSFNWFLEQTHSAFMEKLSDSLLIVCIFFLSNMMNYFFKCRFTYLLTGLNYEKGIVSFEGIISNGLKIGCSKYVVRMINTTPEVAHYLKNNYRECLGKMCLYRTAFKRDQASLILSAVASSAAHVFIDKDIGRSFLRELERPTFSTSTVAYFNKGHPMFLLFHTHLVRLRESGISGQIISKYFEYKKTVEPSLITTKRLELDQIVAPLSLWIVGISLSSIIFIFEIVLGKKRL